MPKGAFCISSKCKSNETFKTTTTGFICALKVAFESRKIRIIHIKKAFSFSFASQRNGIGMKTSAHRFGGLEELDFGVKNCNFSFLSSRHTAHCTFCSRSVSLAGPGRLSSPHTRKNLLSPILHTSSWLLCVSGNLNILP